MDQMVKSYYRNNRFKWPLKVFIHLLYICMNNAHITYLEIVKKPKKHLPLKKYIQKVIEEFTPLPKSQPSPPPSPATPSSTPHIPMWAGKPPRRAPTPTTDTTLPVRSNKKSEADRKRGHCVVCNLYTPHYCTGCNPGKKTYLHLDTETGGICWSTYHTTH